LDADIIIELKNGLREDKIVRAVFMKKEKLLTFFKERIIKNIGYIAFLGILAVLALVFTLDRNPGHIYIGPSEAVVNNVSRETAFYAENSFATGNLLSKKEDIWGVSVRFGLSETDRATNAKRTTREIVGIKKDFEEAESNNPAECIHAELFVDGELIGDWDIALSEIRPGTDTKFVFAEAITGMKNKTIQFALSTEAEESRAITISNIQLIERRISANTVQGIMVVIALGMLALSVAISYKFEYHKAFLILGSLLAVLWLIAMPYGRVPDEEDHFFRIYEISQGHLISESKLSDSQGDGSSVMNGEYISGRTMPGNLDLNTVQHRATLRDTIDNRNLKLDKDNLRWYSFPNMALYSPISYLPQLVGVVLMDLFTDSVLLIIYTGRILGLAVTIVALYFALKLIPIKKECLFVVALLPMLLQEAVSLSADSFINALAIFFIGYIFYLIVRDTDKVLSKGELMILWMGSILIALCKVVYLPICTLCFLIPVSAFGCKNRKCIHTIGTVGVGTGLNLLWISLSDMGASASGEQVEFIMKYPLVFIEIVVRTVIHYGDEVFAELLGSNMGGLNIPVDEIPLLILGVVLVVLAVAPEKESIRLKTGSKFWIAMVWMAVLAMTWGSMYLGYNKVGNNLITGFQGRYFIPIILLMLVSLENRHFEREIFDLRKYLYPLVTSVNIYVLFIVLDQVLW